MESAKKRGRPKRPVPLKKITIRIPFDLDEALFAWAQDENLTLSALTARILQDALTARHQPAKKPTR